LPKPFLKSVICAPGSSVSDRRGFVPAFLLCLSERGAQDVALPFEVAQARGCHRSSRRIRTEVAPGAGGLADRIVERVELRLQGCDALGRRGGLWFDSHVWPFSVR